MQIEDLGKHGESLFKQNVGQGEQVLAKIKGFWGEGMVVTDSKVYLLKWGGLIGSLLGVGRGVGRFEYTEIANVVYGKGLLLALRFTLKDDERKISIPSFNAFKKYSDGDPSVEDSLRKRIAIFGRGKDAIVEELVAFIKSKITP